MKKVVVLGASGDLGSRIGKALIGKAEVVAPVRSATLGRLAPALEGLGVRPVPLERWDVDHLARSFEGADTVVSALSGLRSSIVDAQTIALDAAVQAGVPKFMPSDFAVDFRRVPSGANRNLNLREEFRRVAETRNIQLTSILNGAFMDMLSGVAPFILYKFDRVLCWGSPNQLMDWTMVDDVAAYTAHAAVDASTPRFLNIVGSEVSATGLAEAMTALTGREFKVLRPGGPRLLGRMIAMTKLFVSGRDEVYPAWQGMQYMRNMYEGDCKLATNDNARYPVRFTPVAEYLDRLLRKEIEAYVPNTRKGAV